MPVWDIDRLEIRELVYCRWIKEKKHGWRVRTENSCIILKKLQRNVPAEIWSRGKMEHVFLPFLSSLHTHACANISLIPDYLFPPLTLLIHLQISEEEEQQRRERVKGSMTIRSSDSMESLETLEIWPQNRYSHNPYSKIIMHLRYIFIL